MAIDTELQQQGEHPESPQSPDELETAIRKRTLRANSAAFRRIERQRGQIIAFLYGATNFFNTLDFGVWGSNEERRINQLKRKQNEMRK